MQFDLLSRECEREERKVGIDVKTISASTSKRVLAQCDKQQLRLDMPFYYYCEQDATKVITIYSVCLSLNGSGVCVRTEKGVPHSISISIINSTKNQRHLSATAPVVRRWCMRMRSAVCVWLCCPESRSYFRVVTQSRMRYRPFHYYTHTIIIYAQYVHSDVAFDLDWYMLLGASKQSHICISSTIHAVCMLCDPTTHCVSPNASLPAAAGVNGEFEYLDVHVYDVDTDFKVSVNYARRSDVCWHSGRTFPMRQRNASLPLSN